MSTSKTEIRPMVAGNWKMNGMRASLAEIAKLAKTLQSSPGADKIDVWVAPPATLIASAAEAARGAQLAIGAQDCHINLRGPHTGDLSAEMLLDAGATFVITGHSERRTDHGETDAIVKSKAQAANAAGLVAIVCIGETAGERSAGLALDVVRRQIMGAVSENAVPASTVIAYEPVWAIGTGVIPTAADVADMHLNIRLTLEKKLGASASGIRILYGGSVKPENARELMSVPNVNGALVGGASLKADDFLAIIAAYA